MQARIYKDIKNAMQSGRANTKYWVLEYENNAALHPEPLMGWTSSQDTLRQVRLFFETEEDAVDFAKRNNLMFTIVQPAERKIKPKAYADNFRHDRLLRWTH